jgi:hypothetical protein
VKWNPCEALLIACLSFVAEGTLDSTVPAVKRVNELDFYSLGLRDLAGKLGENETHLLWLTRRPQ